MKKILTITFSIILSSLVLKAQDTMYIHKKGGEIIKFAVEQIDSIKFAPPKVIRIMVSKETISAKWNIEDAASEYKSVEFNESGNYIMVRNSTKKSTQEEDLVFGTYKILNENTIELSNFGIIVVNDLTNNSVSLTITPKATPSSKINISAVKAEISVDNTPRTELLCRTWNMDSVAGYEEDSVPQLTVLFSNAGTYFVNIIDSQNGEIGGLAKWRWKDNTEKIMCYSWDEEIICDEENQVEIATLTSKSLVIKEEDITYYLSPSTAKKSARIGNSKTSIKKGIFRK